MRRRYIASDWNTPRERTTVITIARIDAFVIQLVPSRGLQALEP